ncbi:hypothetical protein AB0395_45450 [Streptosporangium sp. NPDC051023]|uniref:hypothetical protein n=1 Tax=Streptosporangium sp. NPDC051023 TaxID=3155410 RepID=UPI00344EF633
MTRTAKEAKALVRDAERTGLKVEQRGDRWHITNPITDAQVFLPLMVTGRSVANYRSEIRRLGTPPAPMVAATQPPQGPEVAMPIEELLELAAKQGVRVEDRGGVLRVSSPMEAEPLARLIRDRSVEVLAHLNPPVEESPVPKISEMAAVTGNLPVRDVAADARRLWQVVRGLAATQDHPPGQNAGAVGVIWHGALLRVLKEAFSDWDTDWRRDVSTYLERTNHMKCQSRSASPPVWWVREEWTDGGLTVTKVPAKAPKPAAPAKPTPPRKEAPAVPVEVPETADPLALLTAVAKRVSDAETRADEAELMVATLEEELERVRGERDAYKAQVEQINNAFKVLAGGAQ